MSALARFYKSQWYNVCGSDSVCSSVTEDLENEWIQVLLSHCECNIFWDEEKIFYTEAISEKNIELQKAKKLWLNTMTYFEWVWEISKNYKTIAIAWAHWKSTTTSMIAILLQELWLSPSCIVWTKVPNFWNKNFLLWNWEFLIVEACEYRESFLNLEVFWEVILNIEAEHLDYFKTEKKYLKAFNDFSKKIEWKWNEKKFLIWNKNCKNSKEIFTKKENKIKEQEKKYLNKWKFAKDFNPNKYLWLTQKKLEKVPRLQIPWNHIKFDALCAVSAVEKILLSLERNEKNFEIITKIFWENWTRKKHFFEWKKFFCWRWLKQKNFKILQKKFSWTWRRFENIWNFWNNTVISDYAHHPTEIKATLKSAKQKFKENSKIITIFEPHQYSRTIQLFDDFCKSFWDSDLVIIPSIFEVRDIKEDVKKMSAKKLAEWINKITNNAKFLDWYEETEKFLRKNYSEKDNILIFMWAGNIDKLARKIIKL